MLNKTHFGMLFVLGISVSSLSAFSLGDVASAIPTNDTNKKAISSNVKTSDLTSLLVSQLGVDAKQANGGTGSILNYAKNNLSDVDYSKIASAIPESKSLLNSAPSSNGGLGGLTSSLGGNSKVSGLATLASQFSSLGLSTDMVQQYLPVILGYLKGSGSSDAVSLLAGLFK
jgi:hypothetical protein